jgi:hypothetical protein
MSKMVELLNQRAESTFTIDQDEFNQKAQHILDTVVKPQVDKYEQRKLLEQMMAQDQEAGMYGYELIHDGFYVLKLNSPAISTTELGVDSNTVYPNEEYVPYEADFIIDNIGRKTVILMQLKNKQLFNPSCSIYVSL